MSLKPPKQRWSERLTIFRRDCEPVISVNTFFIATWYDPRHVPKQQTAYSPDATLSSDRISIHYFLWQKRKFGDCNVRCPYHGADCVVCIGLNEVLIEVSPWETIVTHSDAISLAFRSMAPCNLTIVAQYIANKHVDDYRTTPMLQYSASSALPRTFLKSDVLIYLWTLRLCIMIF